MPAWLSRLAGMMAKEFVQMRRDRMTFAMMLGIPVIQLTLFGFAIDTDPKHLPTAVVVHESTPATRAILARGEHPSLLVAADATDPVASGNALAAVAALGTADATRVPPGGFEVRIHRRDNPEGISQYNIVPGLMGVILTMTMVLVTAVAITREHEKGTMEYLLVTPVRPLEVMVGMARALHLRRLCAGVADPDRGDRSV